MITMIPSAFASNNTKVRKEDSFEGGSCQFSPPKEDVSYAWQCSPIYSREVQLLKNYNHALNPIQMSYKDDQGHRCLFL